MSFFSAIDADLHTFGAWAEKELKALVKAQPEIEKVADAILKYAGGALAIAATAAGGVGAGAAVAAAVADAQTGVVALNGLITDFGATPTAASISSSIATNLSSVLTAAKVTDPVTVTAVTGVVTNLTNLATVLSAPVAATPVAHNTVVTVS